MKGSAGSFVLVSAVVLALAGPALAQTQAPPQQGSDYPDGGGFGDVSAGDYQVYDPWEGFNRKIYAFNDVVDRYAVKPVAQFYLDYVPSPVSNAVTNFFSNLSEPINLVNNLLQLKGEGSLTTGGRFVFNTTFGLLGLFDVATGFGLPEQDEDFGQTLGFWGSGSGPFVMLPLLGPSTVRDTGGFLVDTQVPVGYDLMESPDVYYARALQVIDLRARLIPAERGLIGDDRYRAIRNAYLQRREFQVQDGRVEDPFANGDDEILEDF